MSKRKIHHIRRNESGCFAILDDRKRTVVKLTSEKYDELRQQYLARRDEKPYNSLIKERDIEW